MSVEPVACPQGCPGLSLAACSPVLEPVLRVLQPGLQVPDAHLLLLQWGQVLLRRGRLDAMVVTAQCVSHGAPVRECLSARRDRKDSKAQTLCLQEARGHPPHHPGPVATRWLQTRPPAWGQGSCGHKNTQPFWKKGFIKPLQSEDHSIRAESSGSSSWGRGDLLQSTCTSLATVPGTLPTPPPPL